MKANTGKSRRKTNKHENEYWDRLQKQFSTCQYDHAGAYGERVNQKSDELLDLQRRIEANEQIMEGPTFQKMRANGQFRIRTSDRLLVAGQIYGRARA
jgi:hypothetical protein